MPAISGLVLPTKSRLDTLTILRFAAALWVLSMHLESRAPLNGPPWTHRLFNNGAFAMTLFFVLSGTVLAYSYRSLGTTVQDALVFYRARFARIYVPYALLHVLALFWFSPSNTKELTAAIYSTVLSTLGIQAWFPNALLSGANSGTWSISVEFFFYALFPALLPMMIFIHRRYGVLRICAYLSALSGFIGLADYVYSNGALFNWMPTARLPEFIIGMGVGLTLLTPPRKIGRNNLPLVTALFCGLLAAFNPVLEYGLWIRANFFVVPVFAWVIYELARWDQSRPSTPGHASRILIYLGESSYCFFLAQLIPMFILGSNSGKAWVALHWPASKITLWIATFAVTLVGAILSHELIEKPARRWLLQHWRPFQNSSSPS